LKIGQHVTFHPKVFKPPYTPYYDEYEGHTFQIIALHEGGHIELKCVSGDVKVAGYVHSDVLQSA
jgi:hypothetical protein